MDATNDTICHCFQTLTNAQATLAPTALIVKTWDPTNTNVIVSVVTMAPTAR